MPLQKILFKPGVNRENTRYTNEGGWYESDKVRFRQGTPEVIGGWARISANTFVGVCRSLWNWATLAGFNLMGIGTNIKFYVENTGVYNDITPIRSTVSLGANPFLGNGTTTVTVTSASNGAIAGDYVTFSGVTGTYATLLNQEYSIVSILSVNTFTITTASAVVAGTTGGSGVVAAYQINIGPAIATPLQGWGAGYWGNNTWGNTSSVTALRLWSQANFGQDLIFAPRNGNIYYWTFNSVFTTRGIPLGQPGATLGAVSITAASPAVVTLTGFAVTEGTAIQFNYTTGGSLPSGLTINTTYYVFNLSGTTFNLLDSTGAVVNTSSSSSVSAYISLLVDVPVTQNLIAVSVASRVWGFWREC